VLPANQEVTGLVGVAIGGAVFLLAVQPALVAARSAPRLWGWLLFGWFVALATSALLQANVPAMAVMAVGLGLTSTALSGPRRPYVAWAVVLGYAILGYGNARTFGPAARAVEELRRDVRAALEVYPGLRTLVVDPLVAEPAVDSPGADLGVGPVGAALPYLVHPRLQHERESGASDRGPGVPAAGARAGVHDLAGRRSPGRRSASRARRAPGRSAGRSAGRSGVSSRRGRPPGPGPGAGT